MLRRLTKLWKKSFIAASCREPNGISRLEGAPCCTEIMRRAIDSPQGRALYGRRFATVEPVFANIRHNKKLNRFTLRGRRKVDTQWKLYCLVHNIEKLAHHGYGR